MSPYIQNELTCSDAGSQPPTPTPKRTKPKDGAGTSSSPSAASPSTITATEAAAVTVITKQGGTPGAADASVVVEKTTEEKKSDAEKNPVSDSPPGEVAAGPHAQRSSTAETEAIASALEAATIDPPPVETDQGSTEIRDRPPFFPEEHGLEDYFLEKRIGKGQFSSVYSAIHRESNTVVALKTISISKMDTKARGDCLKEINLLRSLDHENIVQHRDSFVCGDQLLIVLELATAGDLARLFRHLRNTQQHLSERTVWKYFVQIADAFEYMHGKRIMHRDVKPANVFLTGPGVIKVGDFGLGRFFSPETTAVRSLVGTPYYMAPERINELEYDFRSDVWSLGCLLYEFTALRSPFYAEGLTLAGLCRRVEACDYPPPRPGLSSNYTSLVARMVHVLPERRAKMSTILAESQRMYASFYGREYIRGLRTPCPSPSQQTPIGTPAHSPTSTPTPSPSQTTAQLQLQMQALPTGPTSHYLTPPQRHDTHSNPVSPLSPRYVESLANEAQARTSANRPLLADPKEDNTRQR